MQISAICKKIFWQLEICKAQVKPHFNQGGIDYIDSAEQIFYILFVMSFLFIFFLGIIEILNTWYLNLSFHNVFLTLASGGY